MLSCFCIESFQLVPCDKERATVMVYSLPTDAEKEELLGRFDLDPLDLEAVCDPDEVPRVEIDHESAFIIWKRPDNVSCAESIQFDVSSLGVLAMHNMAVFIVPRGDLSMSGRDFRRINSVSDCVFRVLLHTIHHYLDHLKAIKMMSQELQAKIVTSMGNKYLLQMFALGESLVYYHNALEADFSVLAKLRSAPERLKLTADEVEFLDDVMIENQQATKQASIYSTVLSGLMDARGSIVNNNMNDLLKNLTMINVVFMPLNLLASIGGMSEFTDMTKGIDMRISYTALFVAMLLIGCGVWWTLVNILGRHDEPRLKRRRPSKFRWLYFWRRRA